MKYYNRDNYNNFIYTLHTETIKKSDTTLNIQLKT